LGEGAGVSVRFTPKGFREFEEIYAYLSAHSPKGAASVMGRLEELTSTLAQHPEIGVRTNSRRLRRLLVQPYPYFIFYRVSQGDVVIHGVRHAARDPRTMPGGGA
jgi:toxin ParE1/3/4